MYIHNDTEIFWTVQSPIVMETLYRDGIYYVKKRYIKEKYGDTAWIFMTAYDFLTREMSKSIPKPDEAESPVWIYKDPKWPFKSTGSTLIKLKIPEDAVICFDHRDWSKILNLSLLGTEGEIEAFEKEMSLQGVTNPSDVFEKPFYPLLKNKISKSWKRLLGKDNLEDTYTQGAVWMLKKEWILEEEKL